MNCKQCGAPMVLYRKRAYHHCEHCGSYHFPDPDQEGIRTLGENPDGVECPVCKLKLDMMVIDDFYQGYQCSNCRGLLFNRSSFRDVIDTRRSLTKTPPEPFNSFDPAELDRKTFCPICETEMETFQYLGPGNIVIDTCHQDDLIWLDYGELQRVVNAPGRDRGVPRKKPIQEEEELTEPTQKEFPRNITLIDLISAFFDQWD